MHYAVIVHVSGFAAVFCLVLSSLHLTASVRVTRSYVVFGVFNLDSRLGNARGISVMAARRTLMLFLMVLCITTPEYNLRWTPPARIPRPLTQSLFIEWRWRFARLRSTSTSAKRSQRWVRGREARTNHNSHAHPPHVLHAEKTKQKKNKRRPSRCRYPP